MTDTRPVDLAAPPKPTDWKVVYGQGWQLAAYFSDREKAVQFAVRHNGYVVPLAPV